MKTASNIRKELIRQMESLPSEKIREILDFVLFIKSRDLIDTDQLYFWSERWQKMEQAVEKEKDSGRIIGDGSAAGLISRLKK
ncbi:MAG: hypothetical protein PHW04_16115 [Candidatus Wallbacteria bacterium]|nr:hypothetical protein [Candidatus Wallbacteria bacterium]